ncbi:MAG: ABC transporter ATP-binding protein [Acidimicrobiia bacterium]|jgi:ABC-2 type transport system ATP-binding protein
MDAITVEGLVKHYGPTVALDGLSFTIGAGRLTGFLGPNGAGKTTTFRLLLGLTRPDAGSMEVLGMRVGPDTSRIVKQVGAIVEEPGLHRTLSAADNLRVAALTLGVDGDEIPELLRFVALDDVAHRRVEGYSKGMRQRLALAVAMLGDPEALILDEPLDGLDPAGQVALKAQLRRLVEERGKTIIVSSHDLSDVEQLADDVVVVDRGRRVVSGALREVLDDGGRHRVRVGERDRAVDLLRAAGLGVEVEGDELLVSGAEGSQISRVLAGSGVYPSLLAPETVTLERVFLELTGETGS